MPTTVDEVQARPLIGFDRRPSVPPSQIDAPVPISRELFAFRSDSDLAAFAALKAGFGLGVCQHALARRYPDLIPVPADVLNFELGVWVVMHQDLKGVRRMRLMFDHLVAGLTAYVRGAA